MKKNFLFFFLSLFVSTTMLADPWDNLTKEQAEETAKFLNRYPYILDYCDCCDHSGEYATKAFLMRVVSVRIISSEWSEGEYSVKAKVRKIAQIPYTEKGLDLTSATAAGEEEDYIILMNYTFGYSPTMKKAVPLFDMIDYGKYSKENYCKGPTSYPNPKKLKKYFKDKEYHSWYKRYIS